MTDVVGRCSVVVGVSTVCCVVMSTGCWVVGVHVPTVCCVVVNTDRWVVGVSTVCCVVVNTSCWVVTGDSVVVGVSTVETCSVVACNCATINA